MTTVNEVNNDKTIKGTVVNMVAHGKRKRLTAKKITSGQKQKLQGKKKDSLKKE